MTALHTPSAASARHRPSADAAALSALAFALIVVSPLASFALSALLLTNLGVRTSREVRWMLTLAVVASLSLISGARPIDPGQSNDIDSYYLVYQALAAGDLGALTTFGAGLEVALPLLMLLLVLVLPPLTENGLMFCFALVGAVILAVWVERSFYRRQAPRAPALLGVFFVMLNLYYATQLSRQFLSLAVLLFALTAKGWHRRALCLVIAALFHTSAVAFFAIYLLVRRGWVGWVGVVVIAVLLRLYFAQLLVAADILPEAAAEKLNYYLESVEEFTDSDLNSLRTLLLVCLISVAALLARGLRVERTAMPWLAAPWVASAVHYILLPIPLVSLRTTLAVHAVLPGLLVYQMFGGRARRFALPVFNLLLAYKVAAFATADPSAATLSTLAMLRTFAI